MEQKKSPMVLIPPPDSPNEEDARALKILVRLDNVMASSKVRNLMNQCINKGDNSVRRIQTDRYEIFVRNAADKGSACFDKILRRFDFAVDTKDTLLDYAKRQALKDDRLSTTSYKFGNFSIISTYEVVDVQAPHIDLLKPNYQFGLVLSCNSPGTLVYEVDCEIQTIRDWKTCGID